MMNTMDRQATRTLRVVVADDDARVRSALRLVLEQVPGLAVEAELGASRELARQIAQARPNVLVLDWEQPEVDSGTLLPALRSACPGIIVVALASRPEARSATLRAGADHFVCKSDPPEALLACLAAVVADRAGLASAA
jgi:two-component system, NarL family, response regulator DesR